MCRTSTRSPNKSGLRRLLVDNTFADTVFFTNSGTEAAELAIKMARKFHYDAGQPERIEIVAFEGAFHGRSTGAIAAAGSEKMVKGFGPLMPGFKHLKWPTSAPTSRDPGGDHRQDLRRDGRADPGRGRHPPVPDQCLKSCATFATRPARS
jgi:acetylornithine/N-succinyldiaminopimelate aminotransferase